jgi:hypothetical protein
LENVIIFPHFRFALYVGLEAGVERRRRSLDREVGAKKRKSQDRGARARKRKNRGTQIIIL